MENKNSFDSDKTAIEILNWVLQTVENKGFDIFKTRLFKFSNIEQLTPLVGLIQHQWSFKTGNEIDTTIIAFFSKFKNAFTEQQQKEIIDGLGETLIVYFARD